MKLEKIKRPGGVFCFSVEPVVEDAYGVWLYAAAGTNWNAPHDKGTLPMDVLVLLCRERYCAVWWVDDPADKRVEVDVCLLAQRTRDGWSYVDLELDPVRHENGAIEIQDRDEFEAACRDGWIAKEDATVALSTAITMEATLRSREEPFGDEGWRRLNIIRHVHQVRP